MKPYKVWADVQGSGSDGEAAPFPIWKGLAPNPSRAVAIALVDGKRHLPFVDGSIRAEEWTPDTFGRPSVPAIARTVAEAADAAHGVLTHTLWMRDQYWHLFLGHRPLDLWFRAEADRSWPTKPTALRCAAFRDVTRGSETDALGPIEAAANIEFHRRGRAYVSNAWSRSDAYIVARHHAMPSRLLDWTTSLAAALFFACADKPGADARLLMLDVSWPQTLGPAWEPAEEAAEAFSTAPKSPRPWTDPAIASAIEALYDASSSTEALPTMAVLPPMLDPRMTAQQSVFTLHASGRFDLDSPWLYDVTIPKECKTRILRELQTLGTSRTSLFPDLCGLAKEVSERWDLAVGAGEPLGFWLLRRGHDEVLSAPHDPTQSGEDMSELLGMAVSLRKWR